MVAANTHWQSSKIFLIMAQIILRLKYDITIFIRYIMYAFDGCTLNLQTGKAQNYDTWHWAFLTTSSDIKGNIENDYIDDAENT